MGTVGDLAAVGAVAVLGYVGIKWLSGQNFGGSNGTIISGGSLLPSTIPTTPSPSTQPVIDEFDNLQQGLVDATYIKKELNETLDVGSNVAGGLTKTIFDLATNSIIGDILGTKNAINGITTSAALNAVKKQNNTTIKDAAESITATDQQELRSQISNLEGLTAAQKRDLERSLKKSVA